MTAIPADFYARNGAAVMKQQTRPDQIDTTKAAARMYDFSTAKDHYRSRLWRAARRCWKEVYPAIQLNTTIKRALCGHR